VGGSVLLFGLPADCDRDDLVDIASDKFGTHVLCKAVAVKELEVDNMNAVIQSKQAETTQGTHIGRTAESRNI
jgi:hypothetical protein